MHICTWKINLLALCSVFCVVGMSPHQPLIPSRHTKINERKLANEKCSPLNAHRGWRRDQHMLPFPVFRVGIYEFLPSFSRLMPITANKR